MGHSYFENRVAAIATMHQKERAIAPIVEPALGIKTMVPPQFDTDAFGTFTRDVDRAGSQVDAARRKAQKALEVTGHTLAIASEGSLCFPIPAFPLGSGESGNRAATGRRERFGNCRRGTVYPHQLQRHRDPISGGGAGVCLCRRLSSTWSGGNGNCYSPDRRSHCE
ncbi:MAG: hypothetical protein HC925_07555, partial [Coleofasciculaceae cyanobacterium SM2_3_26]|nr:hypothetical protein [Coleofasciculaceae cyanobacterium SM2_3_26]